MVFWNRPETSLEYDLFRRVRHKQVRERNGVMALLNLQDILALALCLPGATFCSAREMYLPVDSPNLNGKPVLRVEIESQIMKEYGESWGYYPDFDLPPRIFLNWGINSVRSAQLKYCSGNQDNCGRFNINRMNIWETWNSRRAPEFQLGAATFVSLAWSKRLSSKCFGILEKGI